MKDIIFACIILGSIFVVHCYSVTIPKIEYVSLQDLFNATNGENWNWEVPYSTYGYPWVFNNASYRDPCDDWQGLTCTCHQSNEICTVSSIFLSDFNMDGTLPDSFGNFLNLTSFSFYLNNITGTLPASLGNLSKLGSFDLGYNRFEGTIPSTFSSLSELHSFLLMGNTLYGNVSDFLFQSMNALSDIEFGSNNFSGPLPDLSAQSTNLRTIDFSQNLFISSLPAAWSRFANLTTLSVQTNHITGPLPAEWGRLKNLLYFDVSDNYLSQSLPSSFDGLTSLLRMIVNHNHFTGTFPASWCKLGKLELLEIFGNSINGTIPSCIGDLIKLQRFTAQSNNFVGKIPLQFSQLSSLTILDLSVNMLTGLLPPDIGDASSIQYMTLTNNFLTGSLPVSFVELRNMISCDISYNLFNSSLPRNLSSMQRLSQLSVNNNAFTGLISDDFGELINLDSLALSFNFFHGQIPKSLGKLPVVDEISLTKNLLTGSIPEEIYNLSSLTFFSAGSNFLNGTISSSIGKMISLEQFYVLFNDISGSIPESFGALTNLIALALAGNQLIGTIPFGLFRENSVLQTLYVGGNHLHGEIPTSIVNATQLAQLQLKGNMIGGSLENLNFSALPFLNFVDFSENSFFGRLPISLWTRPVLKILFINNNAFSGSIGISSLNENCDGCFRSLQDFIAGSNQFTGPILGSSFALQGKRIVYLNLSSNYFSGGLDESLSQWENAIGLGLGNNYFSGPVSNRFMNMSKLTALTLSANLFTGSLSDLINSQGTYISLAIDNNGFTGSIPVSIFSKGTLQSFVASINCLSGTLPSAAICFNSYLEELLLDGLHSSTLCSRRKSIFFGLSKATLAGDQQVKGEFPICLLESLRTLSILHLSGNALSGRNLQNVKYVIPGLSDLDLSHNMLSGRVSSAIWQHNFTSQLDLSFNRLSGDVENTLSTVYSQSGLNSSISLHVNRFSGTIPENLEFASNVNILEGNMFSCTNNGLYVSSQQSNLPVNDPNYESYACGSDSTNSSLLAVGALFVVLTFCFLLVLVLWGRSHVDKRRLPSWTLWSRWQQFLYLSRVKLHFWWTAYSDPSCRSKVQHIYFSHETLRSLIFCLRQFSLLIVFCGIPLYVVLSFHFGTYTHQYIWTAALAFLRGTTPATALLIFLLMILGCLLVASAYYHKAHSSATLEFVAACKQADVENLGSGALPSQSLATTPERKSSRPMISYIFNVLVIVVDVAIVVAVNAAYVYAVGTGLGVHALVFVSLAMSIFKLVWNSVVLNEIIAKQSSYLVASAWKFGKSLFWSCRNICGQQLPADTSQLGLEHSFPSERLGLSTIVHVVLTIFNNVVAPYLAEAFVSANCFKYAFTQAPLITSTSQGNACYLTYYSFTVTDYEGVQSSGTSGRLTCQPQSMIPANETIALQFSRTTTISYYPAYTYSFQCSSSLLTSFVTVFVLRYIISGLVLPLMIIALKSYQHFLAVKLAEYARRPRPPSLAKRQRVEAWFRLVTKLLPSPLRLLESMAYAKRSAALPISTPIPPRGWINRNILNFPTSDFRIHALWKTTEEGHVQDNGMENSQQSLSHRFLDEQDAEQERLFLENLNREWILPRMTAQPWYTARSLYVRLVSDLAVLCTFGVLFPPLLIVVVGAIVMDLVSTKVILGRLLRHFQGWISLLSQEAYVLQQLLNPGMQSISQSMAFPSEKVTVDHNPMITMDTGQDGNNLLLDHEQEAFQFHSIMHILNIYGNLQKSLNESFASFSVSLWNGVYSVAIVAACFWSLSLFDILGNQVGATNATPVVVILVSAPLWIYLAEKLLRWLVATSTVSYWVQKMCPSMKSANVSGERSQSTIIAEDASTSYSQTTSHKAMPTSIYEPPPMSIPPPVGGSISGNFQAHSSRNKSNMANNNFMNTPATLPSAPGSYVSNDQFPLSVDTRINRPSVLSHNTDEILSVPHDDLTTDDGADDEDGIRLTLSSSLSSSPNPHRFP
jgi:Leucine-rich repeat (LRR) protein